MALSCKLLIYGVSHQKDFIWYGHCLPTSQFNEYAASLLTIQEIKITTWKANFTSIRLTVNFNFTGLILNLSSIQIIMNFSSTNLTGDLVL